MSAEHAAAGRPYCIQIADPRGYYRPAESLLDLTAYRMRVASPDRGRASVFHAVLYVERPEAKVVTWGQAAYERFAWSYWHLQFVPIAGQGHAGLGDPPDCKPSLEFVRSKPII